MVYASIESQILGMTFIIFVWEYLHYFTIVSLLLEVTSSNCCRCAVCWFI